MSAEYMIRELSGEIAGMLPADPKHAQEIVRRLAQRTNVETAPSRLPRYALAAMFAVGALGGLALDHMADKAAAGLATLTRDQATPLRTRVLIWPDGRSEIYTVEDRASDPRQVLRVLNVKPVNGKRLQEIFGQPVELPEPAAPLASIDALAADRAAASLGPSLGWVASSTPR